MPTPMYPPQFWQQYLQNALNALHQNPNDLEAHQAIGLAESHLAGTDSGGPAFTGASIAHGLGLSGPQTAGDLPMMPALGPLSLRASDFAPGGDVSNVATGVENAVGGIPKGLAQIAHQLGHGDVLGAGKGIVQGIGQTASGAMAPIELALRELTGENVPQTDRASMLQKGGQGLTGLATMEAGGRALGALKRGLGGPSTPAPSPDAPTAPSGPPAGFQPTSASPLPSPGSAGPIEPNPVSLPTSVPRPAGFDPTAGPGASPGGMEAALGQLAKGLQTNQVPGLTSNEATGASAASGGSGAAGTTPPSGFSNPQPMGNVAEVGSRAGQPQGISVEGPLAKPVPPGGYPPTLAQMHGLGGGTAGFTTPEMIKLMIGLPIGSAIMKRMGVTGAQVLTNPSLQSTFMNMLKAGGAATLGGATQAPDTGIGAGNQ